MAREKGIRISPKYGVNPSVMHCFVCGKEYGVALLGMLKGDVEAPRSIIGKEPCDECKKHMREGIILISVDERKSIDRDNPYRTGRMAVVKDDAIRRMLAPDIANEVIRKRMCYVPDEVWDILFSEK